MAVKTRWPDYHPLHFIHDRQVMKMQISPQATAAEYNYASNLKLDEMMTVKCWTLYNHKLLISTPRRLGVKNLKIFDSNLNLIFWILLIPIFSFQTRFCFRRKHWDLRREREPGDEKKVKRVRGFVIPEWGCHKCHMSDGASVTRVTWHAWHSDVGDTSH